MAATRELDFQGGMSWQEVCEHPVLRDLAGFHIDTDELGRVLMTPVGTRHGVLQAAIGRTLAELLPDGVSGVEIAVRTRKGTKAADVAWMSRDLYDRRRDAYDSELCPEISVEVLSPSNSREELDEKRQLYFEQGATEVWECAEDGAMTFWVKPDARGDASRLAAAFPDHIRI